ncbi:M23 family metallopeptidase [Microbacterium telephonicum]|uniref:Peptidase M23-like protein n=1 Tax=Microbacterium telephonicum TaxID=1714841 RepID=A0A498C370_9MICO|nr:M23 family metallopeptidase [Microbacterium telephonicum]RLK47610.1 peptidase M23-like protein [Microbacterium telephonicum]
MLPLPFPASTISLPYGAVDGKFYTFASPHKGDDFSSRSQGVVAGSVIRASGPGVVVRSGVGPAGVTPTIDRPNSLAGNSIDVDYGDFIARYMHRPLGSPSPAVGAETVEGTLLGLIGATGLVDAAHLHLETWDKKTGRRVDPANYFDFTRTVTTGAAAGDTSRPFDPPEEDDMYDDAAQEALFQKIEWESRPYKTYQWGGALILMGPGGRKYIIPSGEHRNLLMALGLTGNSIQRVLTDVELSYLESVHGALSPDPKEAQVQAVLELSDEDAKKIAAAVDVPAVVLSAEQLAQIADAAKQGGIEGVKALKFIVQAGS